ncbi:MAG: ribosomal protein S18-alanine N-acetyltransferase [Gemmatimonadetes bacterium]|nr:ribosomal protein S18-alanine N-acetyltransferase [Gemmatimonadota bacterium]
MSTRSSETVTIRVMTPADIDDVIAIENASYSMPWSDDTFETLLRRGDTTLIVAAYEGAVVGYAMGWHALDQGELGNVAVTAEWRRQGLATRLVTEYLRRQQRLGVRDVFLEVRRSNDAARALYARMGFSEVGIRRRYYIRPVEDALVMRRTLVPADVVD